MGSKVDLLSELFLEYTGCKKCDLCNIGQQKVFGYGNPNAKILIVGIGPGEEEDNQGIPFVGPSGTLLNQALAFAGVDRKSVYTTNLVLCRPANIEKNNRLKNRDPNKIEIEACIERLYQEIYIVDPVLILTLGDVVLKSLCHKQSMKSCRGIISTALLKGKNESIEYPFIPTWHPARILRSPSEKIGDPKDNFFTDIKKAANLIKEYSGRLKLIT
jgi:uracil-DNA glycosylase family 4